jgi:hypothetical protein
MSEDETCIDGNPHSYVYDPWAMSNMHGVYKNAICEKCGKRIKEYIKRYHWRDISKEEDAYQKVREMFP